MDLSKLDKLIHEKARLGIMSLLASRVERWAFQDLKGELKVSDGNQNGTAIKIRTARRANSGVSARCQAQ